MTESGSHKDDVHDRHEIDPRVVLAAERTLLAWLRTGLAMMGFGFVVARFGFIFPDATDSTTPHWLGTGLVLLGTVVNVISAFQHYRFVTLYEAGQLPRRSPLSTGLIVSAVLAIIGLALAGYLLWTQ